MLSAETRTKLSVRITIARITDFAKFQILFLTDAIPLRFFFMLFNVVQEIDLIQAAGKKYDKKNEVISAYFAKEKQESGARNTAGRGTGVARSGKRLQLGRRKKSKEAPSRAPVNSPSRLRRSVLGSTHSSASAPRRAPKRSGLNMRDFTARTLRYVQRHLYS